jgi:hypothetical protein
MARGKSVWYRLVCAMITRAPENKPPTPIPAMALPTMRTMLLGATAQIKEPISKTPIAAKNVPLTLSEMSMKDEEGERRTYTKIFVKPSEARL